MAKKLKSDQVDRLAWELFQSRTPVSSARRPDADFLVGFRSKLSAELEIVSWSPFMIGELCWRFAPVFAMITLLLVGFLILNPFQTPTYTAADQIFWSTFATSDNVDLSRDQVATAVISYEGEENNR
jgi:hypothetical protein